MELALWSAYIEGEQPVSLLVTANVEAGKTELVAMYSENPGVLYLNDTTAYGIISNHLSDILDGKVRHIVIPDFITPMSRKRTTATQFVAFLNCLLEEGIVRIETYATNEVLAKPVKCGLITTLAKGVLSDRRHGWSKLGFMSRLLPVSYDYAPSTIGKIRDSIASRLYIGGAKKTLALPDRDMEVQLPQKHGQSLANLAMNLTKAQDLYGFRAQKHLQRLAMANALRDGKQKVRAEDVERIEELSWYINLDYCLI